MEREPKVLIVDDTPMFRALLREALGPAGFEVMEAGDGLSALSLVRTEAPAAVVLDLVMPKLDGLQTLERLRAIAPKVPVIMVTAHGDIPTAVRAMQMGAYHYLTKPLQNEEVVLLVKRAVEHHRLLLEVEGLRDQLTMGSSLLSLLGPSRQAAEIAQRAGQVADSSLTILIQGETGTGKELVARGIHGMSARRHGAFVALDCGAIPEALVESELFGHEKGAFTGAHRGREGHFRLAHGGTLFLDEVANLSATAQAKLLRALQERQVRPVGGERPVAVDVRVLAASNLLLEQEVQRGRFRQDLYYRLAEVAITLPPLRERREDIPYLAKLFLAEAGIELGRPAAGISEAAADLLLNYSWPGNVRELRNVIRRGLLLSGGVILPEHLEWFAVGGPPVEGAVGPEIGAPRHSLKEARERSAAAGEREAICQALVAARGNKTGAARLLRTDFKTLHLKMRRYGIQAREYRNP